MPWTPPPVNYSQRKCVECGETYTPHSRVQKRCLSCTKYGAYFFKNMSLKLQIFNEKLRRDLDRQVIHLDPVAYENGQRIVIKPQRNASGRIYYDT